MVRSRAEALRCGPRSFRTQPPLAGAGTKRSTSVLDRNGSSLPIDQHHVDRRLRPAPPKPCFPAGLRPCVEPAIGPEEQGAVGDHPEDARQRTRDSGRSRRSRRSGRRIRVRPTAHKDHQPMSAKSSMSAMSSPLPASVPAGARVPPPRPWTRENRNAISDNSPPPASRLRPETARTACATVARRPANVQPHHTANGQSRRPAQPPPRQAETSYTIRDPRRDPRGAGGYRGESLSVFLDQRPNPGMPFAKVKAVLIVDGNGQLLLEVLRRDVLVACSALRQRLEAACEFQRFVPCKQQRHP